MEENNTVVEQENEQTAAPAVAENATTETQERTFTQEEVNHIVADRLKRESAKTSEAIATTTNDLAEATKKAADLEAELTALKEANALRELKDKVSKETGIPASLLTETDEEAMRTQAQNILAFAKPSYPAVKDGGEASQPSALTKADILAMTDEKARIKAIENNIHLFS